MKKYFCLAVIMSLFCTQAVFADETQSLNAFEIPIDTVPPGGGESGDGGSSGLSSGAITAIALGSVFGGLGVLGGVGWYFAKHNAALSSGTVCGKESPYTTVCMEDNTLLEKLKLTPDENKHLIKGIEMTEPADCACKKFFFVRDTKIQNKTFNTVYFEMPDLSTTEAHSVKITQISEPFSMNGKVPALDTKILLNAKEKNVKEVATIVTKSEPSKGILVKQGHISDFQKKIASVNTSFDANAKNTAPQVYAVIVEFE